MMNSRIITADDHPLLLKGLNDFLVERDYNIVGSAADGREAYDLICEHNPDISILDIQMPYYSGLELAQLCRAENISTKIILITLHKERELYERAKELNIYGYILKEFALEEIETCIATVQQGNRYFSPKMSSQLNHNVDDTMLLAKLTPSEKKIVNLIANDRTNKEIASMLFISYRTVEKHRSNIISKLKLEHKTNSLLIWAKENHKNLG